MNAIVSLEGVHRKFGKVKALDGLSLTVREGEVYGFLGRNGAGKTTTLRILMGILSADSGTVSVLGQSGKRLPTQLKQRIGYVSQEQHFYPWMTAQQLGQFVSGFYPTWDETEFRRLLKVLDVPYTRRNVELSGGSRTKLGLALALAPRPPLLLLDEPTAGLDPVARREFNDLVASTVRDRGTTAFFSSHLVDEVQQIAHRVAIIQAGSARFEGEVATLRASVRKLVLPTPAPIIELRGGGVPDALATNAEGATADSGSAPAFGGAAASVSTPASGGEGARGGTALSGAAATPGDGVQAPSGAAPPSGTPDRGSAVSALGTVAEPASAPPFGGAGASAGSASLEGAVVSANSSWPTAAPSMHSPSSPAASESAPFLGGAEVSTEAEASSSAAPSRVSPAMGTNPPSPSTPAMGANDPSSAPPSTGEGAASPLSANSSSHVTGANSPSLGGAAGPNAPSPATAGANANAAAPHATAAKDSNAPSLSAATSTPSPAALAAHVLSGVARSPDGEAGVAATVPVTGIAGASGTAAESSAAPSDATRAEGDAAPSTGSAQSPEARPPDITSLFTGQSARATSDEDTLPPVVPHTARAPILYFLKPEPAMTTPPMGFTRLRGDVWRAEPQLWESTAWPEGTVVDTLSLEDIFLAFARTDAAP